MLRMWIDWHVIEVEKRGISYLYHNAVTVAFATIQIMVMVKWGGINPYDAIVMACAIYWFVFDYGLNAFRNKPLLSYYGDFDDEENLSTIEKYVYANVHWTVLLIAKLILLAAAVTIYG